MAGSPSDVDLRAPAAQPGSGPYLAVVDFLPALGWPDSLRPERADFLAVEAPGNAHPGLAISAHVHARVPGAFARNTPRPRAPAGASRHPGLAPGRLQYRRRQRN